MGKKAKTGKARKDKFYKLAKETGYRARSAFKLLQLNRKFEFLQKSRVCLDLCAAPGSWLQVAVNQMPISSHIIGVDLVPIKSIFGVTTFQGDITTDTCRQAIKKEIKTWRVDVVLHDGAPNVGKSWVHDAFAQAELTLSALKLATEFLRQGGWFVTKVFRSKDYHALLWVFGQMFKKVHATKPQASRNESAEIFVVCQGYIAPDKIDPKFLDPKFVFQDVGDEPRKPINLIHPEKVKRKAEGYAEGDYTLHHTVKVSDFITADNHLEILANCSQLVIDSKAIEKHPATTDEIKECFKDVKLLGKRELRTILTWRKIMKQALEKILSAKAKDKKVPESVEENMDTSSPRQKGKSAAVDIKDVELSEEDQLEEVQEGSDKEEENKVKEQLAELQEQERKNLKRKKKKVLKEKRKLRDKLSLNMVIPGDRIDVTDDVSLFDLKKIKNKKQLSDVGAEQMPDQENSDVEEDADQYKRRKYMMAYDRHADVDVIEDIFSDTDTECSSSNEEQEESDNDDKGVEIETNKEVNPLVIDLDTERESKSQKTSMWFNKDIFAGLEAEEDEDVEIGKMIEDYKNKGGIILGKEKLQKLNPKSRKSKRDTLQEISSDSESESESSADSSAGSLITSSEPAKKRKKSMVEKNLHSVNKKTEEDDCSDSLDSSNQSDSDSDYDIYKNYGKKKKNLSQLKHQNKAKKDGFEIVSKEEEVQIRRLDPIGLALGEEMIQSSKRRRELVEESYNRYTFEDDGLPDWFVQDEARHMRKPLPVSKAKVEAYKERMKAINARPIKKIAEAEARKKKKMMKKIERARKRAENINDAVDTSEKEKWKAIKEVYKKAGLLKSKKEDIAYVVAKRGTGKRVSRPPGIKGRFKVVDPRLKKDLRNGKIRDKKNKRKGSGSKRRSDKAR